MTYLYLIISVLSGVTIVLARILNAKLAQKIGTIQATVINYVVGILFSLLFWMIANKGFSIASSSSHIPFWAYFGGLLGVTIIMLSNYTTPRISAFYLTLLVFLGQLGLSILIDWLVSKDFSLFKLIGSLFVVAGFTYNLLLDRKSVGD